jgi:hypothetical protein
VDYEYLDESPWFLLLAPVGFVLLVVALGLTFALLLLALPLFLVIYSGLVAWHGARSAYEWVTGQATKEL